MIDNKYIVKTALCHKLIYRYGIITILYLLLYFEKEELYEDCQIIYEAIKFHNLHLNIDLPTNIKDIQNIKDYVSDIFEELGLNSDSYWHNINYYLEDCKKQFSKINQL